MGSSVHGLEPTQVHYQRQPARGGCLLGVPLEELLDGLRIRVRIHDESRTSRTGPNSKAKLRVQALHSEYLDSVCLDRLTGRCGYAWSWTLAVVVA